MAIDKNDLSKFSLKELKEFADEEGIVYDKNIKKDDLLNLLIDEFSNRYEDDETEDEDLEEDEDEEDKPKKKKKKSLSSYYNEDDEDQKTKNILYLMLNVRATIIQLRKRLLGEEFDKKKGRYIQMKNKVPLVSKAFANEMEGLIISICNPQLYLSSRDAEEFRLEMRRNLKDFNNKLLNSYDIQTVQKHNDVLNIYWNLILTNLKISYGGDFKLFFKELEIGAFSENTPQHKNEDNKSYFQRAGEYLTN